MLLVVMTLSRSACAVLVLLLARAASAEEALPQSSLDLLNKARALYSAKKLDEAITVCKDGYKQAEEERASADAGKDARGAVQAQYRMALLLQAMGHVYAAQNHPDPAVESYRKSWEHAEQSIGRQPGTQAVAASFLQGYASYSRSIKRYDEAEKLFAKLRELQGFLQGAQSLAVAMTALERANCLKELGKPNEAAPLYTEALTMAQDTHGGNPMALFTFYSDAADFYKRQKDWPKTETLLQRALAVAQASLDPGSVTLADVLDELAAVCQAREKPADAKKYRERAQQIREAAKAPAPAQP